MKWMKCLLLAGALLAVLTGCSLVYDLVAEPVIVEFEEVEIVEEKAEAVEEAVVQEVQVVAAPVEAVATAAPVAGDAIVDIPTLGDGASPVQDVVVEVPVEALEEPATAPSDAKVIVIDAGHQAVGNYDYEPIGPGATETKYKCSSGTTSAFTGTPEYVLTLEVSLKLEEELIARGYEVVMIRTTHDVDMSNIERATIANDLNADAFIRVHANGSESSADNGAFTLCQTPTNPYCGNWYTESRLLSDCVLEGYIAATGFYQRSVWETDTMCGINWCQVPVTIIEMGYMTNYDDDSKMADADFQYTMVSGMADGLDLYFEML